MPNEKVVCSNTPWSGYALVRDLLFVILFAMLGWFGNELYGQSFHNLPRDINDVKMYVQSNYVSRTRFDDITARLDRIEQQNDRLHSSLDELNKYLRDRK
jgi:cell division protein FtsB